MEENVDQVQLAETFLQFTSLFHQSVTQKDFQQADKYVQHLFNSIAQHNSGVKLEPRLLDGVNDVLQALVSEPASSSASVPLLNCATNCYRLCRNACALCNKNQVSMQSHAVLDSTAAVLTVGCGQWSRTEQLTVMLRCAVQFLTNLSSGNLSNQRLVWRKFLSMFVSLLQYDDDKLRQYTCVLIHTCLSGLNDTSINSPDDLVPGSACWEMLRAVVHLCVESETPYGLYVIEDAFRIPTFCDNVYKMLSSGEKILTLEVLLNYLKNTPENSSGDVLSAQAAVTNIQAIAESVKAHANMILQLDSGQQGTDNSTVLCTVKEIECLCVASSNHESYSPLQDDKDLLCCAVCLLQSIDDVGRRGNSVFSNVAKISQEHEINQSHPVFGLKRDLIRLVGNLVYKHTRNQDLVRELDGIPLILDQTNIDGKNPFITQWSIFAIHNLCEDNLENQQCIANMRLEGVANNQAVLDELGITAETRGEKVVITKQKTS